VIGNNAWRHPALAFKVALHRWVRRVAPLEEDGAPLPLGLDQFRLGEIVPLKGCQFRVMFVAARPVPALVLALDGATKNQKLKQLRALRRVDRLEARRAHVG